MKLVTIIGARPQFIKASALSNIIRKKKNVKEIIINTNQHYDPEMSKIFFSNLKIPKPNYNLNVKSTSDGDMIGKMIIKIETILKKIKPDFTIVYGDTNSTLAGAIASNKCKIPIIHIESGLRSFNKNMPEEINRILTDNLSSFLFTPSKTANKNLKNEHIQNIYFENVGDIMKDVFLSNIKYVRKNKNTLLKKKNFIYTTIHRAENTNSKNKIYNIVKNLNELSKKYEIIFSLHPRTLKYLKRYKIFDKISSKIQIIDPQNYINSLYYLKNCSLLITDSGGMQKEAYYCKVPCLTVRRETEWPETIKYRWNTLAKTNSNQIFKLALKSIKKKGKPVNLYGKGNTSKLIIDKMIKIYKKNKLSKKKFIS